MPDAGEIRRRASQGGSWGVEAVGPMEVATSSPNDNVAQQQRPEINGTLDQIPRLMHKLHNYNNERTGSTRVTSSYRDQYLTRKEQQRISNQVTCSTAAGSPTHRDVPYDIGEYIIHSAPPPVPPPRALELVKEEVHRALKAFSTQPVKGEPKAPLPSDLLRPFDVSKDGRVTYRELRTGILGLGIGLTAREAEELAQVVDREGTGLVDRGHFEAAATRDWGSGGGGDGGWQGRPTSAPGRVPGAVAESQSESGALHSPGEHASHPQVDDGRIAHDGEKGCAGGEVLPPPPTPSEAPEPLRQWSRSETTGRPSRNHGPSTLSFDYWQQNANRRNDSNNAANAVVTNTPASTGSSSGRSDGNVNGHRERSRNTSTSASPAAAGPKSSNSDYNTHNNNQQLSQKYIQSLQTLRSLLQLDRVFDEVKSTPIADETNKPNRRSLSFGTETRGRRCERRRQEQSQHQSGLRPSGGGGGGGSCGVGDGKQRVDSTKVEHRRFREEDGRADSPPPPNGAGANGGGRQQQQRRASGAASTGNTSVVVSDTEAPDHLARARSVAARAESILRLRSRGDLVGLRRAVSKADPSASGVISRREMERVILRRFGTGLEDHEARHLAARYRKDFNGRSMVDYGRLFDSLEVKEGDLFGRGVTSSPGPSTSSGRGCWEAQQRSSSRDGGGGPPARSAPTSTAGEGRRRGSRPMRAAAGARTRHSQRRYWRRGVPDAAAADFVRGGAPAEESQLVRRARAKTLALLDRHGTPSVDCVFGLVDQAHTQTVSSGELREALRILGGSDTLSEIEHRALFKGISKGRDRVLYRELLDTLRASEVAEHRERTQRKLQHQAGLPTSGRGSAIHWRHSDVLDWDAPPAGGGDRKGSCGVGLKGGRQHKESRRQALVFQRLRDGVRQIQEKQNSAGPVFDMFRRRGRGRTGGYSDAAATVAAPTTSGNGTMNNDNDPVRTPPPLSPSALRAGLGSLGVPLGNEDFVTLIAATDPDRRGEVTYPTFCEALDLHPLRGDPSDAHRTASGSEEQERPSSAPPAPTTSRQHNRRHVGSGGGNGSGSGDTTAGDAGKGRREGGGGYARRRAMELAPPADTREDLEGGVFHVNEATYGCDNPNFTTTMVPASIGGGCKANNNHPRPDAYRPKRRQSPAPAPGGTLTGIRTKSHGQTLLVVGSGGGDRVGLRDQTGLEAERRFRQGLGVKMRAWSGDNNTDPTPVLNGGRGNRRGRSHTPRDSDLGFGSERMRSTSSDGVSKHCRRRSLVRSTRSAVARTAEGHGRWRKEATGGSRSGGEGGELSPTLRWGQSRSLPQQSGGRQSDRKGRSATLPFDSTSRGKWL
ncbi:hypothetical protein Esi_0000_0311 [Ectocarpus siliculosus]|uniref:Uncharacterized protein n=1 Tax=Ectocarpus siliculosus TaxID=2880 RepID=D8LB86_ECTSI|nr:hypothetical protein Esi_0000_0311 [Ectocarpus siliculosus]|eukprot:CBN76595.1 hypothetical protein Esi_0000_0311 [Ectocarpus siliculosus]